LSLVCGDNDKGREDKNKKDGKKEQQNQKESSSLYDFTLPKVFHGR